MKKAKIRLSWMRSESTDVVEQNLVVNFDNVEAEKVSLLPSVEEYIFVADEKVAVNVVLTASDGQNVSKPAVLDFLVPDLGIPLPPTGLFFEILEVLEEEAQ